MATDWVVNSFTYGNLVVMAPDDTVWLPLTFEQVTTPPESAAGVDPHAHFEDSVKYSLRVRGQLIIRLRETYSDANSQFSNFFARVVRNRMDPITQEPGLPAGTFYNLDNEADANDDFLWQKIEHFTNVTGWLSNNGSNSGCGKLMEVDVQVKRRLRVPEQLWLVLAYFPAPDTLTTPPAITVAPYLRTLLSTSPRG